MLSTDVKNVCETSSILPQTPGKTRLKTKHLEELRNSAIDDEIAYLNFQSLDGDAPYDRLFPFLPDKDRRNDGRVREGILKNYRHVENGGWWVKSLDPETGEEKEFGQFKPDTPRTNEKGKLIKYETPPKSTSEAFFLEPSRKAWEAIAKRYKKKCPDTEPTNQFWQWVKREKIPIILTEGAKKAAAQLSAGYAAIALVGVWNGCRKVTIPEYFPNAQKEVSEKNGETRYFIFKLIPDLEKFAGRTIFITFDQDSDPDTLTKVATAIKRTTKLLEEAESKVKISQWDSRLGKGADDVIFNHGAKIFHEFLVSAKSIKRINFEKFNAKKNAENELKLEKIKPHIGLKEVKILPYHKMNYVEKAYMDLFAGEYWITIDGQMHQWNGKYYEPVEDVAIEREIVYWLKGYEEPIYIKGEISDRVYRYTKSHHVTEILKWAKQSTGIDPKLTNPKGLNLANGILKIKWDKEQLNYELIPHNPQQYYTYCSDTIFDPDAPTEDCDKLLSVLEPDQRDIFLKLVAASVDLQTLRGFSKIGRIPAALCIGQGSNGKDSLRETVRLLFGNQGIGSYSFTDFKQYDRGTKFEIASLINNVRLSWSAENTKFLSLDNLISLRKAISGETMTSRSLHKEGKQFDCNTVFFFNVNELPLIHGDMTAIKSRYTILEFNKTIKKNANPNRGEIEEDPRFKHNKNFIKNNILSAFLNRVLDALSRLTEEGIDTTATEAAFEEARRENNHLITFCDDMGLVEAEGVQTPIKDIYDRLLWWYEHENGVLSFLGERKIWEEQTHPLDKNIKAINQLTPRLEKLFPRSTRGRSASVRYIEGISFNPEKALICVTPFHQKAENPDNGSITVNDSVNNHCVNSLSSPPSNASSIQISSSLANDNSKSPMTMDDSLMTRSETLTSQKFQGNNDTLTQESEETEKLIMQLEQYMNSCQSIAEYDEMEQLPFFSPELHQQAWQRLDLSKRSQIQKWSSDRDVQKEQITAIVEMLKDCENADIYKEVAGLTSSIRDALLDEGVSCPDLLEEAISRLSPEQQQAIDRIRNSPPASPDSLDTDGHFQKGDPVVDLTHPKWGIGTITDISPEDIKVQFPRYAQLPMQCQPDNLAKEGDRVSWHKGDRVVFVEIASLQQGQPVEVKGDSLIMPMPVNLEELRCY
ncbi:MAG: DUF3854 domain-containing protein [Cyanobacteria bacterium SBLK]|nr:DUF3854 domain-containing protein [Cyanobacteria bacterium SBLK]